MNFKKKKTHKCVLSLFHILIMNVIFGVIFYMIPTPQLSFDGHPDNQKFTGFTNVFLNLSSTLSLPIRCAQLSKNTCTISKMLKR